MPTPTPTIHLVWEANRFSINNSASARASRGLCLAGIVLRVYYGLGDSQRVCSFVLT